jgi:hypothetical protein
LILTALFLIRSRRIVEMGEVPRRSRHFSQTIPKSLPGPRLALTTQPITEVFDAAGHGGDKIGCGDDVAMRPNSKAIRHLRRERQRSPRSAAEIAFQEAKTRLLQLRIGEREGGLMMTDEALEVIEEMVATFRTHAHGLSARCSRDLTVRRAIDDAVFKMLTDLADEAARRSAGLGKRTSATNEPTVDADD